MAEGEDARGGLAGPGLATQAAAGDSCSRLPDTERVTPLSLPWAAARGGHRRGGACLLLSALAPAGAAQRRLPPPHPTPPPALATCSLPYETPDFFLITKLKHGSPMPLLRGKGAFPRCPLFPVYKKGVGGFSGFL